VIQGANTLFTTRGRADRIPVEVQDEAELWARGQGRHATVVWSPTTNCAVIELTCKPGDPRLKAYQEGRLSVEPKERVLLHRYDRGKRRWVATPPKPDELTPDFVRSWLERGDMWSGRGETRAKNLHEACTMADRAEEEHREAIRKQIREAARDRARDRRKQVFDLPTVSVPADLSDD
jgi:hypothetical protein